jgi:hypothetical protein
MLKMSRPMAGRRVWERSAMVSPQLILVGSLVYQNAPPGVTHEKTVIIPKIDLDYFES